MKNDKQTKEHMEYAISILRNPEEVAELRIQAITKGNVGGYFNDQETMANVADEYNGKGNILTTLNPVNPALLPRANNRVIPNKHLANEADILSRIWFLIEINPVCSTGVSASDEEHKMALDAAMQMRENLSEAGWPEPVLADSGNGANLLYYVDLPNNQQSTDIIKAVLINLDQWFSNDKVKVETNTFKASQLCRVFGTEVLTGDETTEKSHRVSCILQCPDEIQSVSKEQLEEIANYIDEENEEIVTQVVTEDESQAEALIRLASQAEFFRDEMDEAYAAVQVKEHTELWKVKSKSFFMWLTQQYYEEKRRPPSSDAMKQARGVMEMKAMFEGEQRKLTLRVGELDGTVYYDLADRDWEVVKVTPNACEILNHPPILFVRNKNSKAQVKPNFDGDVNRLLNHVRIIGAENQLLYLVYIITCFVPDIPHPIMVLCGEKGAAKTTSMKMSREVVDPAMRDLLIMPNSMQDLALTIANNYMPCFDNMDGLSSDKSDLLCTASTGGGFSKRMLFTDEDEVILSFKRCVSLNGINVVVTKPDLLDRSIILELERISEENRKEERLVWEEFEADKSYIVGGALSILSKAMAIYPTVQLERLGRMADFTRWGYAIAQAMGYGGDEFLEAYFGNQGRSNEEAISSHPVAAAMVALMKTRSSWKGSVSDLLSTLEREAEKEKINTHVKMWPNAAHVLSRRLNEVKSNLLQIGISFDIRAAGVAKEIHIKKA